MTQRHDFRTWESFEGWRTAWGVTDADEVTFTVTECPTCGAEHAEVTVTAATFAGWVEDGMVGETERAGEFKADPWDADFECDACSGRETAEQREQREWDEARSRVDAARPFTA